MSAQAAAVITSAALVAIPSAIWYFKVFRPRKIQQQVASTSRETTTSIPANASATDPCPPLQQDVATKADDAAPIGVLEPRETLLQEVAPTTAGKTKKAASAKNKAMTPARDV